MPKNERGLLIVQTLPHAMVFKVGVVAGRGDHFVKVSLNSGPGFPFVKTVFILHGVESVN